MQQGKNNQFQEVGYFGGAPEPEKDFVWLGICLAIGFGALVLFIIWYALKPADNVATYSAVAAPTWTAVPTRGTSSQSTFTTRQAPSLVTTQASIQAPVSPAAVVAVNDKPIVLTGSGTRPTDQLNLPSGLIKVIVTYEGSDFFSASLFNVNTGSIFGWVTSATGKYKAQTLGTIDKDGKYLFNVNGEGNWKLEVYDSHQLQKEADGVGQTPLKISGQGNTVFPIRFPKEGSYNFKVTHTGASYATISSYRVDGFPGLLLANASGNQTTEQADRTDEGVYFFEVKSSSGNWTLEIIPIS